MQSNPIDIVILDDDGDICLLMKSVLQFSGYSAEACSNPDALHKTLSETSPRLIIMDMLLAGFDGRDICKSLKNQPSTSLIKIMMMSAHPDGEYSCREAGADQFIEKPFDIDNLLGKVKKILK